MPDNSSEGQQYTEKVVGAILKRAGDIQASESGGESEFTRAGGTSLARLRQAAAEIGIDPSLIRRAARELAAEEETTSLPRLLGGPWRVDVDRLVAGRVDEDNWACVLDEMRSETGRVGFPKTVEKGFEWLRKCAKSVKYAP